MKCPECGAECSREEADVGVGVLCLEWSCGDCGWDESQSYPMKAQDWYRWLTEGWMVGI